MRPDGTLHVCAVAPRPERMIFLAFGIPVNLRDEAPPVAQNSSLSLPRRFARRQGPFNKRIDALDHLLRFLDQARR